MHTCTVATLVTEVGNVLPLIVVSFKKNDIESKSRVEIFNQLRAKVAILYTAVHSIMY